MADRHDIEDVKLTSSDILDVEIKDEDLKNLDLGDDLSSEDILDDDFSDPLPRSRKKRKNTSMTTLVLMLVVVVIGGGFLLLSNEAMIRALTGGQGRVQKGFAVDMEAMPIAPENIPANATTPESIVDSSTSEQGASSAFANLPQPDVTDTATLPESTSVPAETEKMPAPASDSVAGTTTGDVPSASVPVTQAPPMQATALDPNLPPPMDEKALAPEFVSPPGKEEAPVLKENALASTPAPVSASTPESAPVAEKQPDVPVTPAPVAEIATEVKEGAPAAVPQAESESAPIAEAVPEESVAAKAPVQPSVKPKAPATQPVVEEEEAAAPESSVMPPVTPTDVAPVENPDEYVQETGTVAKWGKLTEPRMNIPYDQEGRNLGISVNTAPETAATEPEGTADSLGANIESQVSAATRALDLERYQAAFDMFDSLYKTNKRDERVLMGRAVSLQKLGRNEEAIKAYDEMLALNPDSPEVMTNMLGLVRQQYPSAALQRLLDLRQRYPNNSVVAAQTGLANAGVGNFEEGLRYLSIAAGLEPNNPKHHFNMAVIAERMGKADLAVTYYERALKADALATDSRNKVNRDLIYDRLSILRQR